MPTTGPAPGTRRRDVPNAGHFRSGDGHTLWFKGGARVHDPEWCGACLLASKVKAFNENREEETLDADDTTEPGHTADP